MNEPQIKCEDVMMLKKMKKIYGNKMMSRTKRNGE